MLKTILSAACASALLAGTALAESASHPSKLDRPMMKSGQTGAENASPKMQSEAERRALSERGRRTGEQGGMPSQENPSGANSLAPAGTARTTMGRAPAQRAGAAAGASSSQSLVPECRGMASEEETTRCLNRHMAQMAERGVNADGSPKR